MPMGSMANDAAQELFSPSPLTIASWRTNIFPYHVAKLWG